MANKMNSYISMLRGINVSGRNKVMMKELIAVYESAGFRNARTYVQSGNVVFDCPRTDPAVLSSTIEGAIAKTLGISVAVIVRTKEEFRRTVESNPFLKRNDIDKSKLHVTFLSVAPSDKNIDEISAAKSETDEFVFVGNDVYLYCPGGYGKTKFSNGYFEKKTGASATTRNWKTVNSLLQMADSSG